MRLDLRIVQAEEHITSLDAVALPHIEGVNDPPTQVLDGLALGIDTEHPRSRNPFVEWRQGSPEQETAKPDGKRKHAETDNRTLIGLYL